MSARTGATARAHAPAWRGWLALWLCGLLLSRAVLVAPADAADILPLAPDKPLLFTDGQGRQVRSTDFARTWLLVYFGYTHCSELCPTGLSVLASALEQIGPASRHVQPLFITVDPERDRGPLLVQFTASFDPRLIGLGGSTDEIRTAAEALGASFRKVAQPGADYSVDHTANYTLVDPAHRRAEVLRIAEPYALARKLVAEMTAAGVRLDDVPNLAAYR